MVRLLARVTKILKREKHPAVGNFNCENLSLRIRIEDSARKPIRIPPGLKGRQCTITRSCLKQWLHKKGDYIILNEEESKQCIRKFAKPIRKRKWNDFMIEDSNRDGFAEYSYTNDFLKAVIAPHYGARLLQLCNRHNGVDELYGSGLYESKGYVEMGGIEETLNKQGRPDELWNAAFTRRYCKSPHTLSLSYSMKKAKGIFLQKQFTFYKALPLLHQSVSFSLKPGKRKRTKKKGKKEKKKITLSHRVFFAIGGTPDFRNLFQIPNGSGLRTARFNRPLFREAWEDGHPWWEWQHCHFAPDPGLLILQNEVTNEIMLLFFDRKKLEFLWTGDKKSAPRLQITYKEKALQPKKDVSYGLLAGLAHQYAFSQEGLLTVSKGALTDSHFPLSFMFYTPLRIKKAVLNYVAGRHSEAEMTMHTFPLIPGRFFSFQTAIPKGIQEVHGTIKGKTLDVRLSVE